MPSIILSTLLLLSTPLSGGFYQEPKAPPSAQAGAQLMQAKDWVAAEKVFQARVDANGNDGNAWFQLGYCLHAQKKLEAALVAHAKAASFPQVGRLGAYNAACACSLLGRTDEAFDWLKKATQKGFGNRAQLATDPDLASLREDERFATVLPSLLEGDDLFVENAKVLHTFVGEAGGDQFGWVARVVGDLDGDGALDFATTAPTHKNGSGAVYVYSSRSGKQLFRLDGRPGWQLGTSVEGRVDIDQDGVMDVIAGAPNTGANPGFVLVVSGKTGEVLHTLSARQPGDLFGTNVAGIQDLNKDGVADIAVGAPGAGAGKVYVYSGKTGQRMTQIEGETKGDQFGVSLDGTRMAEVPLMVVGASNAGPSKTGKAYLYRYLGGDFKSYGTIDSEAQGANLGQYFAAFLGDVDGDGVPDAYLSDWGHAGKGKSTGRVYIHSGQTGKRVRHIDGRQPGEGFGTSQAVCGDVNGDGVADLCIGAWQNSEAAKSAGKIYLVSGKDGSDLATWTSKQSGDTLGFDAVGIGDINGDGNHDFLVTSAWSTVQFGRQGRVFLLAGPRLAPE